MNSEFEQLLHDVESFIASGASRSDILLNTCKLLKDKVYHYDWVGFYLPDGQGSTLILDSYFGKSTEHTTIPVGKGVCGQVAENKKLKIVQDVSLEGNYIACSTDVQSEIVVPILKDDQFVAEIDIDSHSPSPFTIDDEKFLTSVCQKLSVLF
ncbi:MAG: GAF domain-containing protein [Mariniphaga sp.]|nr:GAF domain-containing protein [Mariniphaga sp.]